MKILLVAVTLWGLSASAISGIVYQQPRVFPSGILIASETATGSGVQTAYDNFTLAAGASIDEITWAGGYFRSGLQTINSFTISVLSDAGGGPGSVLYTQTTAGNAGQIGAGSDQLGNLTFTYDLLLDSPFNAAAGTTYWLSIVANLSTTSPFWGWSTASGGDGAFRAQQPGAPMATGSGDLAFALIDNPITTVPEPSMLALLAACAGGLAFTRRTARPSSR